MPAAVPLRPMVACLVLAADGDADVDPATAADLPGHLAAGAAEDVYWLTLDGGEVVEVCQQYLP